MGTPLFAVIGSSSSRWRSSAGCRPWRTGALVEAGRLMAYGPDSRALCRRSAIYVDKILHGVKPADLPIEQAPFQLVVNLKTAKALGVTIPPTSSSGRTR